MSNIQPQGPNPYEQGPFVAAEEEAHAAQRAADQRRVPGRHGRLRRRGRCQLRRWRRRRAGIGRIDSAGPSRSPEGRSPQPKPAPARAPKQSDEDKFVAIVQKASADGQSADNDLKAGRIMKKRDKAICGLGGTKITNWTGTVKLLDSNGDGDGVLAVELADGVVVTTWNNAFSDIGSDTLIKNEKLMDRLAEMSEGDKVTFSGQFIRGSDAGVCRDVQGLTKIGKLQEPEFTFRFSDVKAA